MVGLTFECIGILDINFPPTAGVDAVGYEDLAQFNPAGRRNPVTRFQMTHERRYHGRINHECGEQHEYAQECLKETEDHACRSGRIGAGLILHDIIESMRYTTVKRHDGTE